MVAGKGTLASQALLTHRPRSRAEGPAHADGALERQAPHEATRVPSRKWLEFGGGVISGLFNQPGRRFGAGGDHAMTTDSMRVEDEAKLFLGDAWSDPIEAGIRDRIRGFIEELIEEELAAALGRGRYE